MLSEETENYLETKKHTVYEAVISNIQKNQFRAVLSDELVIEYKNNGFAIEFINNRNNKVSCGRGMRYADMNTVTDVRILADESSVEVFVNEGEYGIRIEAEGALIQVYELNISR